MLVDWLCKQKAISPFQADILDAGINGPFRFGNYRIVEPVLADQKCSLYAGVHELTGHPVLIEFFAGSRCPGPGDLAARKKTGSAAASQSASQPGKVLRISFHTRVSLHCFRISQRKITPVADT